MIRLYINDQEIDVSEDIIFPLTFAQADAKHPEKRVRNSSKTIVLPGTRRNNSFFSSAYDLNISDVYGDLVGFDFDPTLRYPCKVTKKGQEIFRGSANLTKVVTKKDVTNGRINLFTVVLFSELADVFQALGDLKVNELGWSDYDYTLSVANIAATWSAATGSGVWVPLIDFGFSNNPLSYLTNELRPYVYIKEVVQKCLAVGGYTLSSDFFDSTLIEKIVWGYGGGEPVLLSSAEVTARRAHYTGDGTATYNLQKSSYEPWTSRSTFHYIKIIPISDNSIVTMTIAQDPETQYNQTTGEIIVGHGGYYNLALSGTFPLTWAYSTALSNQQFGIIVRLRTFVNGALINQEQYAQYTSSNGSDNVVFSKTLELDLSTGDIVSNDIYISTFGCQSTGNAGSATLDIVFDLDNTLDFDFTPINSGIIDGDTVQISRYLPDTKAADFLKDMITMFNLYVGDPDADGVVVMEPQDDYFYATDDVDQWTNKLARNQDIEIQPAANIEGKVYAFKFAQDRDYYKQLYFNDQGLDYGDYNYNVPSTFKKGEKVYELKTAQSCPVQIEGTDIIIPRIIKFNEASGVISPHKGKPRIFFNNGLKGTSDWDLVNSDTLIATTYSTYPQAHHLDSLTSATFDLNFGRPEFVYYTATTYTTDNLFYRHHAQFIRELTGRDSKLVNAYFKLDESDFYENFMRRLCNIDGVLYRKNLIKDWISNSNSLVKVELIKIVQGNSRAHFLYTDFPVAFVPIMDNDGGTDGVPITQSFIAKSYQTFYNVDTSAKDLTVTLTGARTTAPFFGLRPGKKIFIKKTAAANKITITPTSGALIDGAATLILTGLNDCAMIEFDGTNFNII